MAKKPESKAATAPSRIAYHAGPPEIDFSGRHWRIGVKQAVSADQLAAMRARHDFAFFDFVVADDAADEVTKTTEEN